MTINSNILDNVKKIHFVGIGGSGMCALAEIMHNKGYMLTGSDNNESDTLKRIKSLGIPVFMNHSASNIGDADLVVNTAAVHDDNVELVEAKKRGIPVINRAQMLGVISDHFNKSIAVSGTHGKTTTTCMLTQILIKANLDPTSVIGGKLPLIGGNSCVGKSDLLTCEACEFNDSFLNIHPACSVILNIDNDHLEYFKTVDNLIKHFNMFAHQTSDTVIYNYEDEKTCKAVEDVKINKLTFGFNEKCDFRAVNISVEPFSHSDFDIIHDGKKFASIKLKVPGKHNILNALAAAAAAYFAGADAKAIEEGLNTFMGAGRRFEVLGKINGVTIADDYAHHPTELKATLTAAKEMGYKNVWAVFQPFTFSRTVMLMDDFANVLQIADKVVLAEIMGSREVNTYNVYSKDLAAKIPNSVWFKSFKEISDYILANAKDGDLVITLGCGDIYKAAKLMLNKE